MIQDSRTGGDLWCTMYEQLQEIQDSWFMIQDRKQIYDLWFMIYEEAQEIQDSGFRIQEASQSGSGCSGTLPRAHAIP